MLENFTGYEKKNWKNSPDKTTPLSAENLDHMDSGIKMNADAVIELREQAKEQKKKTDAALSAVNTNIANITPDDTAVDGKPWTSKHIVDMLCPPLEVSGNPVQCYPVAGYPLGITSSWEPVQEGSGDPSPDNIRPIKGRDSVTVTRCGANLLDPIWKSKTEKGIQWIVNADGSITIQGTATGRSYIKLMDYKTKKTIPDGLYTLSLGTKLPEGSSALMGHYNNDNKYLGNLMAIDSGKSYASANLNGVGALDCYIDCRAGCIIDIVVYPMLVQGDKLPDAYIPYNGDSATLALPETIYGGSVDAVSGAGESQYNKVNIRMENLNYNINISAMLGYASQNLLNDIQLPSSNSIAFDGVCDCLPTKPASEINSGAIGLGVSASGDIYLKAEGLDSKEAYVAKFPDGVNVCYKVETPTSFSATGNAPVKALSGVNTILTNADTAEVTGREDLIHAIAGQ